MTWIRSIIACLSIYLGNTLVSFGFKLAQNAGAEFDVLCEWLDLPILVMSPEEMDEFLGDLAEMEDEEDD